MKTYKIQKIKSIQRTDNSEIDTIITDDDHTIISDIGLYLYLDKEATNILNDLGSICVGGYMYSIVK